MTRMEAKQRTAMQCRIHAVLRMSLTRVDLLSWRRIYCERSALLSDALIAFCSGIRKCVDLRHVALSA